MAGRAGGQRRISRNHEAVVFPWAGAGPQAFRLSLRSLVGFIKGKGNSRLVLPRTAPPSPRPIQAFIPKTKEALAKPLKAVENRHSGQAKRDPESRIFKRFWIPAPAPDMIRGSPE